MSQTENRILCCSILGDSYSTFGGFVTPESNRCFYNGESKESDVLNIEETWWYQIILKKGYKLEYNNSYSGSTLFVIPGMEEMMLLIFHLLLE